MLYILIFYFLHANGEFSCEHTFPDGSFVNLTALLRGPADLDYSSIDADGFKYSMNVCGVDTSNVKCLQTNSLICQFNPSGVFKQSIARWGMGEPPQWSRIESGRGVVLKFSNGDSCIDSQGVTVDSVALLAFTCSAAAGEAFTVGRMDGRTDSCVYTITFPTVHACTFPGTVTPQFHLPSSSPETHGTPETHGHESSWGITSMLMVGFVCYCCIGCLWRFKYDDARGLDMVPHLSLWSGLVHFVKDLCEQLVAIVRHKVEKYRSGRDPNGQYEEVETIPFDDTDNNL
jgi:hypothetical protein